MSQSVPFGKRPSIHAPPRKRYCGLRPACISPGRGQALLVYGYPCLRTRAARRAPGWTAAPPPEPGDQGGDQS